MGVSADHQGTVGERVGQMGVSRMRLHAGHEHRPSGGQGIGRGAGGGGDDHAIGLVLHDMLAVDAQLKADEARHGALDDGIVERMVMRDFLPSRSRRHSSSERDSVGQLAFDDGGRASR